MPIVSIGFGVLLIALGAWGFIVSGPSLRNITALIPALVGAVLVLLGLLGLVERFLKHAMHFAAMIALAGGLVAGFRFVWGLVHGTADLSKPGTQATGGMTLLCLVFVGLCVNSFIQVRRRRRAAEQTQVQG
jgi:hypothetical protein